MHVVPQALLLQILPAVIAVAIASQHPPAPVSHYGLMTEREWISAMSHFVFGADPEQADAIQRRAKEGHRLMLAKKRKAKATLQQLIAEYDEMLLDGANLPPADVNRLVRQRAMLVEILTYEVF